MIRINQSFLKFYFFFEKDPDRQDRILFNSGHINNNQNSVIKSSTKRRVFVSLPRFKPGVPATLATITGQRTEDGNLLAPFPNWEAQKEGNCNGVTSVYRMKVCTCTVFILRKDILTYCFR